LGLFKKDVNFAAQKLSLSVAQLAEQKTADQKVQGLILGQGNTYVQFFS